MTRHKKYRDAFCSFCRKSYQDVGPLVEGPGGIYICGECIELCQTMIEHEKRRRDPSARPLDADTLRGKLDQLVRGQDEAKEALIVAALCRHEQPQRVLLIGPTRSSKI